MQKRFLMIFIFLFTVFILSGCGEKSETNDNEAVNDENETADITDDEESDEITDDDTAENEVSDDSHGDPLNKEWLAPDPEWESWGYLRMTGEIADPEGEYVEATYTEGKIKTSKGTRNFEKGSFFNSSGLIISAEVAGFEFLNLNEDEGTATVDYYNAVWQFNKMMIPFAQEGDYEVDFGAFVTLRNSIIDVNFDSNGAITDQKMRKKCWIAISTIEDYEQEGEIFEMPVGGICGCFDCASTGEVGETLKMMFRNELTDKREDLLKWINTSQDDSVLEYGDDGFQFECVCYEENGVDEIPCWQYDGPGGAEECPPEMSEEECYPENNDEDTSDTDVFDEDVADIDTVDDDADMDTVDADIADEDTDNDTGDTSGDTGDTSGDTGDTSGDTGDTSGDTGDSGYTDPCLLNPCTDENKTVCTDLNLDGIEECSCDTDFHTEDGGITCVSDSKKVDCFDAAPPKATSKIVPVIIKWNGTEWQQTPDCDWECDDKFHTEDKLTCVSDMKEVDCADEAPENASSIVVPVEIYWDGSKWSDPEVCKWECDDNFHLNKAEDGCLASLVIGWCNTQWPVDDVQYQGAAVSIYGRVWINGVTSGTEIDNSTSTSTPEYPQLIAQVGYGNAGTSALSWPADNWSAPAVPNEDYGDDDEFVVKNIFTSLVQGEYDFVFRFSGDSGTTWTYCNANRQDTLGYNGTTGEIPYDLSKNGHLEILVLLCGNNVCDTGSGENPDTCPEDCDIAVFCGDNNCDSWEDEFTCAIDCGGAFFCGDGNCDPGEDEMTCPGDCYNDPCVPNPCTEPPDNYCSDNYISMIYDSPGLCMNMGGGLYSCDYNAVPVACSDFDMCVDGECI